MHVSRRLLVLDGKWQCLDRSSRQDSSSSVVWWRLQSTSTTSVGREKHIYEKVIVSDFTQAVQRNPKFFARRLDGLRCGIQQQRIQVLTRGESVRTFGNDGAVTICWGNFIFMGASIGISSSAPAVLMTTLRTCCSVRRYNN